MIEGTRHAQAIATQPQVGLEESQRVSSTGGFSVGIDRFDWICIAALMFSFILINRLPFEASKYGDIYFHEEAQQLARVVRGLGSWHEIQMARAPLPVLYYAVPYLFVSPDSANEVYWQSAVVWNAFWMLISVLLIRRAGNLLGGDRAGKIAAVLSLILPFAVYYSFGIAAETPAYVASVVFAYGWALWRKQANGASFDRATFIACSGFVALLLCRPNALVVTGVACACAFALWKRSSSGRLFDIRFAATCAGASLVAVLLVSLALNHLADKRGVNLQASNFYYVLLQGSFQFRKEPWDWRNWGKGTRTGSVDYRNWLSTQNELLDESTRSGVPVSRLQMAWSLHDILHHPVQRLKMFAIRVLALNVWVVHSTVQDHSSLALLRKRSGFLLFHILLNIIALVLPLISIWFLVTNRREFFAYWPLWGTWLGLLLFHSFVYAEPRYMLPGQPGEILMTAFVMAKVIEGRKFLVTGSEQLT